MSKSDATVAGADRSAIVCPDPAKDLANIAKHGIDLAFGRHVLAAADCTTIRDTRREYGEERLISRGTVAGRVWVVVHTNRTDAVRIISVRKANAREQRQHGSR